MSQPPGGEPPAENGGLPAKLGEERLAAYVRTAFRATMAGAKGQQAIQYVNKLSNALLLLFGAKAVIDGELTVVEAPEWRASIHLPVSTPPRS